MNQQTSQKDGRWEKEVDDGDNQEADQLHVGPEHHRPVGDQAVRVDHPWQAEDRHSSDPEAGQECRPGADADKEESEEKAESEEDDQLGKEDGEQKAPEGDNQGDEDNTEPATVEFGIV